MVVILAARNRLTTLGYDGANRLIRESIQEAGEAAILTTYAYDAANNRTSKSVTAGAGTVPSGVELGVWSYLYNNANQLTQMEKRLGEGQPVVAQVNYSYDANGNRISRVPAVIPATTASNTAAEIAKRTTTYGWDLFDRLLTVSQPVAGSTVKQTFNYSYDYRTRRTMVHQVAQGTVPVKYTAVVFSGGVSVAEYEKTVTTAPVGAGTTAATKAHVEYMRGPDMGGGVGGLLATFRNPVNTTNAVVTATVTNPIVARHNLSNGRGDIVAQSDASATLTWTASYEAYGKRTKETGQNKDKQRANTKDEDPTGLLNEGHRYRDIETGGWLSRDPAGFVDGPNLYAYVKQNPWTGFDPDGLMTWQEAKGYGSDWLSGVGQMWAGYGDVTVGAVASAAHAVVSLPSNVNSIAHSLADISTHDLGTLGKAGVSAGKEIGGNVGQAVSDFGGRLAQGDERTWGQAVGTVLTLGGAKGAQFAKAGAVTEAAEVSASAASTAAKAEQAAAAAAPEVNATRAGGLETRGYKPSPGERTLDGYVKQSAAQKEIGLYTDSAAFDFTPGSTQFKRFGADSHAGLSPHVHQPIRNMTPNGPRGTTGTKTKNDGVTKPTQKDVKQLYENLNNGKHNE